MADKITSYIDIPALQKETAEFLGMFQTLKEQYASISGMQVSLKGAEKTKDVTSGMNSLGDSISKLTDNLNGAEKAQRNLSKAALDQLKIAKEQSVISKNNAAALALEAKAQKDLAAAEKLRGNGPSSPVSLTHNLDELERERLALEKTGTVVNEIDQSEADAAMSAIEWANAQKQVTVETEVLQKTEAELAAEREAAAIANENSINQQKILVAELAAEIKNMTSTQLKSNYGQQLVKDFEVAKAELTALEIQGGVATKASEKAASTTVNIFQKSFSAVRQLANILPGIGVAGLLAFAIEPITKWVTELFKAKDATDQIELSQKTLNDSLSGSSSGFAKATELVDQLRINIDLAKQGFLDKDKVVKEYNDTIGKTTGKVNDLKGAEQELQKNADAYVKMMLYKSAATLALQQASEKALKAAQDNLKKEQEFVTGTDNATSSATLLDVDAVGAGRNVSAEREQANRERGRKRKEQLVKESEDAQATFERIAKDFQTKAAKIAKDNKFDLFGGTEDDKGGKERNKKLQDEEKAFLELLKFRQEQEAKYNEEISGIEFLNAQRRIDARKAQSAAEIEVLKTQSKISLLGENVTASETTKIREKLAIDIEAKESELATAIIAIRSHAAEVEKQIDKDTTAAFYKEEAERDQARRDAAKKQLDDIESRNAGRTNNLNLGKGIDLLALEKDRKAGLISEEDYQKQREKIENDTDILIMKARLDMLVELLAMTKDKGPDVVKAEAEIAALRADIEKKANDNTKKSNEERHQDTVETLQKIQDVYNQVADVVSGAFNIDISKQKNDIQEQIDALDEKTKKEIEGINNSTDAEERKAARIQVVQARAAAQKEQLEKRQRQLDQQKAVFDKANSIFQIVLNTAIAIAKDLGNPLKVALDAALGAAQLAIAIATPLPKYRYGKNVDDYEGFGIVGDGGRKEAIIRENGNVEITPAVPTLTFLKSRDIVLPDANTLLRDLEPLSFKQLKPLPTSPAHANADVIRAYSKFTKQIVSAIENKPTANIYAGWHGISIGWKNANRYWEWHGKNMQSE